MASPSVPTPAEIIESFPEQPTKIPGLPTYQTLRQLRDVLKTNAASVETIIGGGMYGHLGLILPPHIYNTIVPPVHQGTNSWTDPPYPGINPAIPPNATPEVVTYYRDNHKETMRIWKLYLNVNAALRKNILTAVDEIYLRALKAPHTGFSNLKARDMLSYLFQVYGKITPQALEANDKVFKTDWDPTTPFEMLIDQIESAQEFAQDGNQPYSDRQILTQAYNLVYKTGMFFDDCREWNKKPPQDKTWVNFKKHFLDAQEQVRMQQTTQQTGYYGNALDQHLQQQCLQIEEATRLQCLKIEEATQQMINTVKNSTTDMSTITAPTAESSCHSASSNISQARFEEMFEILNKRLDKLEAPRKPRTKPTDRGGYCWTHGYLVDPRHNSMNCKKKKPGHQDNATRADNMGGSQYGKPT